MRLLVDNQLPLALAVHVRGWRIDCTHVLEAGLDRADDVTLWDYAKAEQRSS